MECSPSPEDEGNDYSDLLSGDVEAKLNQKYVEDHVLTNTDRFLEEHITGSFRKWHLILMITSGILGLSKYNYSH